MPLHKLTRKAQLAIAGTVLLGLGAAGGAAATSLTRPAVQMAPTVQTAIAKLPTNSGVVTVRGKIAEIYGDRIVLQDASGRAMIDVGREAQGVLKAGAPLMVQGRYDDGQLRASYLVDQAGEVTPVRPDARGGPERGHHGPGGPGEPLRDGPPHPGAIDGAGPPPPPPSIDAASRPNCPTAMPPQAPGAGALPRQDLALPPPPAA